MNDGIRRELDGFLSTHFSGQSATGGFRDDPTSVGADDHARMILLQSLVKRGDIRPLAQARLIENAILQGAGLPLVTQLHETVGLSAASQRDGNRLVSPASIAAAAGDVATMRYLLPRRHAGVTSADVRATCAMNAGANGHLHAVLALVDDEKPAVPAASTVGAEAIDMGVRHGKAAMVQDLLARGFRSHDDTLLQAAAGHGDLGMVKALLASGAREGRGEAIKVARTGAAASEANGLLVDTRDWHGIIDALDQNRKDDPNTLGRSAARLLGKLPSPW